MNPDEKRAKINALLPSLKELVSPCQACGHACGADRVGAEIGSCGAGAAGGEWARWQAALLHFGEEPMLVGDSGSGTVFFSYCCMSCVFCQNWQISHEGEGRDGHFSLLAQAFLSLQEQGAVNINLVTPTQYILPILCALELAYAQGLRLPVVYNTNAYDSLPLLRLLEGVVDVWLPDMKYMSHDAARQYSKTEAYPDVARAGLREMYRQSGPLRIEDGVAVSGVMLRHLVLPNNIASSYEMLLWLHDEKMTDIGLSLMSQYSPQYQASRYPEISRSVTRKEYDDVVAFAEKLSFNHILFQNLDSADVYLPDFKRRRPFQDP
ncbi:MAG: radical SAM protein [Candidatus Hydrogenedentales bacterium]|jgi:putative pyruvate formate lyase activating enzyme